MLGDCIFKWYANEKKNQRTESIIMYTIYSSDQKLMFPGNLYNG